MRIWTGLAGALSIAAASALPGAAQAQDWCGFHQKAHSQVQCGYSSLRECRQALADKADDKTRADKKDGGGGGAICLPDPASG
ncbi:MAG TPA: hypothetical protein VFB31_09435 [Pseudolabrys sp.]|nr:hypothetical protein [Pseudolabrys sp.]